MPQEISVIDAPVAFKKHKYSRNELMNIVVEYIEDKMDVKKVEGMMKHDKKGATKWYSLDEVF